MQEVVEIQLLEHARTALNPVRIELLERLVEPQTCAELARDMGLTPQRLNNHLKELLKAKLIRVVRRRKVRNLVEATYQAVGKTYWLSPKLVRRSAETTRRDRLSLHSLLLTAEAIQDDVAALLDSSAQDEVPSLGFSVDLHLRSEDQRNAFTRDVLEALKPVVEKYQGPRAPRHEYKLRLVCYPSPPPRNN